jgi:hypothetical protein
LFGTGFRCVHAQNEFFSRLLEPVLTVFSKCALKSLNNQADFDSAIRRFDPSRPSHFNLLV